MKTRSRAFRAFTVFTLLGILPSSLDLWYFMPVASAQEVVREESAPSDSGESPLSTDTLAENQRLLLAQQGVEVNGDDALRQLRSAEVTPTETKPKLELPKPFSLAKNIAPVATAAATAILGQTAGQVAAEQLQDAQNLRAAGDRINAAKGFFQILDAYPNTLEGKTAFASIISMGDELMRNEIPAADVQSFAQQLPTWQQCRTAESKYILLALQYGQAVAARKRGDDAAQLQYFAGVRELGLRLAQEHSESALQAYVIRHVVEAADEIGGDTPESTAQTLTDFIESDPPSAMTWVARALVAGYQTDIRNDPGEAYMNFWEMMSETEQAGVNAILADATVDSTLKAWYLHYLGFANFSTGSMEASLPYFERILAEFPNAGIVSEMAAYNSAHAQEALYKSEPELALQAYQNVVDAYPKSAASARSLSRMAGIYSRADDYESALTVYEELMQRYPASDSAKDAEGQIDYLLRNNIGIRQVAGEPSVGEILAQACGPRALRHLLALKGIPSTVEELAMLAGTSAQGTTMFALAEASKAKGVELVGVRAEKLAALQTPFIAFVRGDHFVLVEQVAGALVLVQDGDVEASEVPLAEFEKTWHGEALVPQESLRSLLAMTDDALLAVRGGGGGDPDWAGNLQTGLLGDTTPNCINYNWPPTYCKRPRGSAGNASPIHPSGSGSGVGASFPSISAPGATVESIHGSTQSLRTGISTQGVNSYLTPYQAGMHLVDTDFSFDTVAGLNITFARAYHSPYGKRRCYLQHSRATGTHAHHNNIGESVTHTYNSHLRVSGDRTLVVFYDAGGNVKYYERDATSWNGQAYDHYIRKGLYQDGNGNWVTQYGTTYEAGTYILRNQSTGAYTFYEPDGLQYNFTADDATYYLCRMTSISDVSGNAITLSYDDATIGWGRLTKVEAPAADGRYLALEYDTNSRITKAKMMKTGSGTAIRYVDYAYNGARLTKVTEDGQTAGITYDYWVKDAASNAVTITKVTDKSARDYLFTYEYKAWSGSNYVATKVTLDTPDGRKTKLETSYGTSAVVTNLDGTTVLGKFEYTWGPYGWFLGAQRRFIDASTYAGYQYQYENDRNLTAILGPSGATVATYGYDSSNRLTKVRLGTASTDPIWNWEYGANGYASKSIAPDGEETFYYYDSLNRPTKTVAPHHGSNGLVYAYNSLGLITRVTDPDSHYTDYQFNGRDELTKVIDPYSKETVFAYDDFGRQTAVTDANNRTTTYYYSGSACSSCGSAGNLTKVTDALGKSTEYFFDNHNDMTKMKDALAYETLFYYDVAHRQTKVHTPEGRETITAYNKLGQVTSVQDPAGKTTSYYYDYAGNLSQTTDAVGSTYYYTGGAGNQTKVKDGLNHEWTYAFDLNRRMTTATDPSGKITAYFYDKAGRVTKTGAGSGGTTLPTEYFYHPTKGYLTKVTYDGNSAHAANYAYNNSGELTKITDWLDGTNGIRYAYDNAGRLTSLTDYDNTSLTYAYDSVGNVTSMTDYHGNATTYAYDARNMMTSLTAPGSKVWTFYYLDNGALNLYVHGNGMVSGYGYDDDGALTRIYHVDGVFGSTVEEYNYSLSASGNITKTTHLDGSYWDYLYDGRNRLTSAVRKNSGATIKATYTYTYDAGDNMITKVEPWVDDFGDGNATDDWLTSGGTWSVASGAAQNTSSPSSYPELQLSVADDDQEVRYTYSIDSVTSGTPWVEARLRWETATGKFVSVDFYSNRAEIWKYDGSAWTMLAQDNGVASTTGTKYNVRVQLDGANFKVWRATAGGLETQVFSVATAPTYNGDRMRLLVSMNTVVSLGNVMVLADDRSSTTSFTTATNNELSNMTDYNGSNTFAYDAWGRMTSRTRTGVSATYDYGYGMKLTKVTSTYPDEGTVTYQFGGDGKRRARSVSGGDFTWYNWDVGYNAISEEAQGAGLGNGALAKTYAIGPKAVGNPATGRPMEGTLVAMGSVGTVMAEVSGTTPGSGSYGYYLHDNLGSSRALYDQSKVRAATFEYSPYGLDYAGGGNDSATPRFAGMARDALTQNYFTPYRTHAPYLSRWLSRDPLSMADGINTYWYAKGQPADLTDPLGLLGFCSNPVDGRCPPVNNPPCNERALRRAESSTGATDSIRHCVYTCEMKKCYGWLGGVLGDWISMVGEHFEPSNDWYDDVVAGNEGRRCTRKKDKDCGDQCRKMGW